MPLSRICRDITGQRPVVTRAKRSVAAFSLRTGMPIGVMVTLRGDRMWEFLDRLANAALPGRETSRVFPPRALMAAGNYTLGLKEQLVFPEIDYDKIDKVRGMEINHGHDRCDRPRSQGGCWSCSVWPLPRASDQNRDRCSV